jgi:hypothetical protein
MQRRNRSKFASHFRALRRARLAGAFNVSGILHRQFQSCSSDASVLAVDCMKKRDLKMPMLSLQRGIALLWRRVLRSRQNASPFKMRLSSLDQDGRASQSQKYGGVFRGFQSEPHSEIAENRHFRMVTLQQFNEILRALCGIPSKRAHCAPDGAKVAGLGA